MEPDSLHTSRSVPIPVGAGDSDRLLLWMARLRRRAEAVGREGEVPVAAALIDRQGRCLGWGSNRRHTRQDPLGHAELVAITQAARLLGDWRLNHCTLIVTLEPCPMCAGALVQARVGRVVFGAPDPKRGGLGGCIDLANHSSAHHHMTVVGGLEAEQASQQLGSWFRERRESLRRRRQAPSGLRA